MAIRHDGVTAVTVDDLLNPAEHDLRIPHYQRPYSWTPATALQLVDDIRDAQGDQQRTETPYVLGAVILHEHEGRLDVVDGQQRLLTLVMILGLLERTQPITAVGSDENPVSRVWRSLSRQLHVLPDHEASALGTFVRHRCQLVRVITDDVDEAFRVFDSQNYRGKPLAPHDLLKAYHLREMRGEDSAMKAAVVKGWESVRDRDLDRLFGTYLYRIARWSRGERAPGFTIHDIAMFKGIAHQSALTPASRYHLAAQAALPMLTAWGANGPDDRGAGRSRFQLDVPLLAGRPFFEMVTFMLEELNHLARQSFTNGLEEFSVYDTAALEEAHVLEERYSSYRYRYVCELYLAAMLYYTNRFGDELLDESRAQLFAWAYAPRIELLRVQFRSIDNRGRGDGTHVSAFPLIRNAATGRTVNHLPTSATPYRAGHEALLNEAIAAGAVR